MMIETDIFDLAIATIKDLAKVDSVELEYQHENGQSWWLIINGNYYDIGANGTDLEKVNATLWDMINGYEIISGKEV